MLRFLAAAIRDCLFSVILAMIILPAVCHAQIVERERPSEWEQLVRGGQFIDLFEPMPIMAPLTRQTWGGDNVLPRDVTNGIEDPQWSYWCGDPWKSDDGVYHLFTVRWPENEPRGHFAYSDSIVVHATASHSLGPYEVQETIGPGHNADVYKTSKGEYVIYCTHGRYYVSKDLHGPWKAGTYQFDQRERYAFKNYVNFSFASRDDGSMIAVSRRGYIWASQTGAPQWAEVSSESVYPKVDGVFEDPVIWKDDVQYHIIVNDWKGRIAYYLRSKDGFHWKTDPGEAYAPGLAKYEDGTVPKWYKYERIRVLQDNHGRPTQAHFAVIDTDKHSDLPSDDHSSKHICIPLTVARLIEVLGDAPIDADTDQIVVRVKAEPGFNPQTDMNLESLRFGASDEVNYGRGGEVVKTAKDGADLIVTFGSKPSGITSDHFSGKLLGSTSTGNVLFGWSRLPGVQYDVPVLSALSPTFEFTDVGLEAYVEVQNFGNVASPRSTATLTRKTETGDQTIGEAAVRSLQPFEKSIVRIQCTTQLPRGSKPTVTVSLESIGLPVERFTRKVTIPTNDPSSK